MLEIKEHGIKGFVAGPAIADYKRVFSFAVKKGDAELLERLNQGLLIVKTSGEYEWSFMSASSWPASGKAHHRYGLCLITLCVLFLLAGGCSPERYLRTAAADPQKITGEFTVILYGARYAADMQNVALLDKEEDGYSFAVFAPHFDYKVMTRLRADGAIAEAERHTRSHHASRQTEWRSIQDFEGNTVGFEARPLYAPLESGYPDILDISYTIDGSVVTAHIRFKPEIEKAVREEEAPSLMRMRR